MAKSYGPRRPYGHGNPKIKGRNLPGMAKEAEQEILNELIKAAIERRQRGEIRMAPQPKATVEEEREPLPSPAPLEPPGERNALTLPPPPARAATGQLGPSAAILEGAPTPEQRAVLEVLEEKVKNGKPRYSDVDFE